MATQTTRVLRYRIKWAQYMPFDHVRGRCKYPSCESLRHERGEWSYSSTGIDMWSDRVEAQRLCDVWNEAWKGSFYYEVEEVWRTSKKKEQ